MSVLDQEAETGYPWSRLCSWTSWIGKLWVHSRDSASIHQGESAPGRHLMTTSGPHACSEMCTCTPLCVSPHILTHIHICMHTIHILFAKSFSKIKIWGFSKQNSKLVMSLKYLDGLIFFISPYHCHLELDWCYLSLLPNACVPELQPHVVFCLFPSIWLMVVLYVVV